MIQNDRDNRKIRKTVIASITSNLRQKGDPSHLFVDPALEPSSGLSLPSVVSCNNIVTVDQNHIRQVIGHLSDALKKKLNDCLKAALELT